MKIRIMGTQEECNIAKSYYQTLSNDENVKNISISNLYPNRGSSNQYRLYVEIDYYETMVSTTKAIAKGVR